MGRELNRRGSVRSPRTFARAGIVPQAELREKRRAGHQPGTTAEICASQCHERGALVPMPSVSFGSQEPLSRQTAGGRTSTQDEEGVW